jgi:hypothetical protein
MAGYIQHYISLYFTSLQVFYAFLSTSTYCICFTFIQSYPIFHSIIYTTSVRIPKQLLQDIPYVRKENLPHSERSSHHVLYIKHRNKHEWFHEWTYRGLDQRWFTPCMSAFLVVGHRCARRNPRNAFGRALTNSFHMRPHIMIHNETQTRNTNFRSFLVDLVLCANMIIL